MIDITQSTMARRRLLPAMLACLSLAACARSNEGAVDLRRTAMSGVAADHVTRVLGERRALSCRDFNHVRSQLPATAPPEGAAQAPPSYDDPCALPLDAKNFSLGTDQRFQPKDHLSIALRTAFIKDFFEVSNPLRGGRKNGEIAVVANAFEMVGKKELAFKPQDLKSGRVVFYSDDVEPGQFLNMNNLPLYGPKQYDGAPVAVRISIFELDVRSEQAKSLLKGLAAVGAVAYAPAAPVLGLLNSLGEAFASGDKDDVEFRYAFTLDPQRGSARINNFALEAGNYVLVRSEVRTKPVPWERLVLNENDGRLYWKRVVDKDPERLYTDESYVVVEINKNSGQRDVDLEENTFGALLEALKNEDRARAQNQQLVFGNLRDSLIERAQLNDFNRAKRLLIEARDAPSDLAGAEKLRRVTEILDRPKLTPERAALARGDRIRLTDEQIDYLAALMAGDSLEPAKFKTNKPISPNDVPAIRTNLKKLL